MADMSNIEEYRASVLSALGIEDDVNIRYFADYRKALLMGLSMPASNEDLRNEEKFRLKILEAVSNTNELIQDLLDGTEYTEKTVSGNPASFDDGAYGLPLKSLLVDISPKQKGSGDPSPTNIREIEPWTEVKIYQSGEDTNNYITKRIPLNREVYGGTLDVISGVLRITHGYVDLGSVNWNKLSATGSYRTYFYTGINALTGFAGNGSSISAPTNAICSSYEMQRRNVLTQAGNTVTGIDIEGGTVYIADTSKESLAASEFKTAINGVQLVCELATPTEIQLTPTEVKTLLGNNNIWAETGDVTVEYLAK